MDLGYWKWWLGYYEGKFVTEIGHCRYVGNLNCKIGKIERTDV